MIEIRPYNTETEYKVNDGVAPNTILYSGLIEDIPEILMDTKIGYENLWDSIKDANENDDSVLIIEK